MIMMRAVRRLTAWCLCRSTCASLATSASVSAQSAPASGASCVTRLTTLVAIIAIIFDAPVPAGAQALSTTPRFNVTPTLLVLRPNETSTSLLLKNESTQPIRFQVSAFSWSNELDGQMKLETTKEVVFFPSLFSIGPGQTRRVRVATNERATTYERTYRLILEQLPSRADTPQQPGVEMLTRLNVPLFLQPGSRVVQVTLDHIALKNGALTFDTHNTGTVHVRPEQFIVRGISSIGGQVFEQRVAGWYLLPGETRLYQVPLDPDVCRSLASVMVTATLAQLPGQTLEERAPVDTAACKTP
jgi:fimbrial chaperone protein